MVNQADDTTELRSAQAPAALFDDFARPHGFEAAARWRHGGRLIRDGGGPTPSAEELGRE